MSQEENFKEFGRYNDIRDWIYLWIRRWMAVDGRVGGSSGAKE